MDSFESSSPALMILLNIGESSRSSEDSDVALVVLKGIVDDVGGLKFDSAESGFLNLLVATLIKIY